MGEIGSSKAKKNFSALLAKAERGSGSGTALMTGLDNSMTAWCLDIDRKL